MPEVRFSLSTCFRKVVLLLQALTFRLLCLEFVLILWRRKQAFQNSKLRRDECNEGTVRLVVISDQHELAYDLQVMWLVCDVDTLISDVLRISGLTLAIPLLYFISHVSTSFTLHKQ